jgi:hypothetical protein
LNGWKERASGKRRSIKGKNIITRVDLESIREAELATQQRKRKCFITEPVIGNIIGGSSSNAVGLPNSAQLPDFVEGGFILSFKDKVSKI